jgi:hypothetical protein
MTGWLAFNLGDDDANRVKPDTPIKGAQVWGFCRVMKV